MVLYWAHQAIALITKTPYSNLLTGLRALCLIAYQAVDLMVIAGDI